MIFSSYHVLYEPAASGQRFEYPLQTAVPQRLKLGDAFGFVGLHIVDRSSVVDQICAQWHAVYHQNEAYADAQFDAVRSLSASNVESFIPW